jgi:hypothetical protein
MASKGSFQMFAIFSPSRQAATALAGAFISAMLFVTAAVGPLPIA